MPIKSELMDGNKKSCTSCNYNWGQSQHQVNPKCGMCISFCNWMPAIELLDNPPIGGTSAHKEMVNHPKHYNTGSIEVINAIEEWKLNFPHSSC